MSKVASKEFLGRLARELRIDRECAGLTQQTVAEGLGVSQSLLSRMESGEFDFRVSLLFEYYRVLGGGLRELVADVNRVKVVRVPEGRCAESSGDAKS